MMGLAFESSTMPLRCGPPSVRGAPRAELDATAAWIRQESDHYRRECARLGLSYVDVGILGFEAAMTEARRHLLGRPTPI